MRSVEHIAFDVVAVEGFAISLGRRCRHQGAAAGFVSVEGFAIRGRSTASTSVSVDGFAIRTRPRAAAPHQARRLRRRFEVVRPGGR